MNIKIELDKDFEQKFIYLKHTYGEDLASFNGLGDKQLNYTTFINNFTEDNRVADVSVDGSANVAKKDVTTLEAEMNKPHEKLIAFNKIYYENRKKWGKEYADQWLEDEWYGREYLHDACSSTLKPYCFAYDLKPIVEKGMFFANNFNAQPPKHLITFTDFVVEFVSWAANRSSGAVGLPNFLIYSYYFWKKDIENNYYLKSPEYYRDQEFQRFIHKLNQPYLRIVQSAFTNITSMDREYIAAIFGSLIYPDGTEAIDYLEEIIDYQKAFMNIVSQVHSTNMMTFPVLTFSLLRQNEKFQDEEFARWACKHNMDWNDSNFFVSKDITSLSNCCRLVSNIKNLGYFNSLGSASLEVGSVKVNTINLARIAYETSTKEEYLALLRKRVDSCCKILDTVRHIIKRNIEKGLLPNYSLGLIHLESQYNTVGTIGTFESLRKFNETTVDQFGNVSYTENGLEFAKQIFKTINKEIEVFKEKYNIDYQINIENVPAETCAYKLMQKDKIFYPNEKYDLPLYGNQWIPLAIKTTLKEKLNISSVLDKACNGGSIAHINLDAPLTDFDTAWKLLNNVSDTDTPYFAFCSKISACKNNHGYYGNVCPICGNPTITKYSRIVGFLVPDKTYSTPRKKEFEMRSSFNKEELNFQEEEK